jgi:glycosyltransferase involved in cell wall biosynthesis
LGTDLACFPETRNDTRASPLVFGTAARTHFGGIRKGFSLVVAAFRLAFAKEQDVLLRVKCFAEDPLLDTGGDKRIEQFRGFLSTAALADWYRSINVFVSGSASEGWGRHQQEAMCMGRPVIGIAFGGVCEFFNEENGYACDWRLVEGEGIYRTMGHYAKPTVEGLAAQMRLAYEDRRGVKRKGLLAAASARRFTIAHSADRILAALREFKMLP